MTIINKKTTTINAIGTHTNGNCKPVFCITDGKIYASAIDAVEANGVRPMSISLVVNGRQKTCRGKRFCLVTNMSDFAEEIAESLQTVHAKAVEYDKIVAREEAVRKANEELNRRREVCDNLRKMLAESEAKLVEAEFRAKEVM